MTTDDNFDAQPHKPRRRWGRRILVIAALIGIGGIGGFGLGMHKAGAMFWRGMDQARLDPTVMTARVDRHVDRVLSRVNGTAEQKGKVSAIAKAAITDLSQLGLNPREMRSKALALFRADRIEPDAFEALRADQHGKWEAASKRITQAIVEAAQVLTPEQRRDLTQRWFDRLSS